MTRWFRNLLIAGVLLGLTVEPAGKADPILLIHGFGSSAAIFSDLESWLRLRFDAISVSKERYNRMSAPAQKAIIKSIQRIMAPLPLKKTPFVKAERNLEKVEKLIGLFEPFILRNEHDFIAENVEKLSHALVPGEKAVFAYDTRSLDWWEYWIDVHIPALRRWTYPLIEGRPLEARPPRRFQLENGDTLRTGTNGATWRFS